jgi:lipoprotein-anchoring transpeptidase ErfK/SrfK
MNRKGLRIIRVTILFCLTAVILTPVFAKEINEKKYKSEDFIEVINILPLSEEMSWTANLPENEEAIKIKRIEVDLSEQKMRLYENDKMIKEALISSGRPGMETPFGDFKIYNKFPRAWSKSASLWMPYWMAFLPSGFMGIHELPEWPNGRKEGETSLGHPASHGCIRLGVGDAKFVYDWAEIGTPVKIIY